MEHEGFTPGPCDYPMDGLGAVSMSKRLVPPVRCNAQSVFTFPNGGYRVCLAHIDPRDLTRLAAENERLRAVLKGCADALNEAGKDFAAGSKYYARPNLYDLHAEAARAALSRP
jgi:hypothetical protein